MRIGSKSMWVPSIVLIATGCVAGAALAANNNSRSVFHTAAPGVWLANDAAGSVSHVGPDGVDATVGLKRPVGQLRVVQLDGVAYIADDSGRLSRVDPAQLEVSQEAQLPSSKAKLVAGGGRLYAVDGPSGTARELDPVQLTSLGEAVAVAAELGDAVVDGAGVLWVVDVGNGQVMTVQGRTVRVARKVADPGSDVRLTIVGTSVVAVNRPTAAATVVSGSGSHAAVAIPIDSGATMTVPDAVGEGSVLPILNGSRSLVLLDIDAGQVRTSDLAVDGHSLGMPRVSAGRVYIPDFTTGSLIVIDIANAAVARTVEVTGKPGAFDVLVDKATVYVNDPHSEQSWAINAAGDLTPATKYDPTSPSGNGTTTVNVPPAPALPPPPTTVPPGKNGEPKTPDRQPNQPDQPTRTTQPTRPDQPDEQPANPPVIVIPPTTRPSTTEPSDNHGGQPPTNPGQGTTDPTTSGDAPGNGAVRNVVATGGDGSASASWQAPERWRDVTGYTVVIQPGGRTKRLGPDETSFTVDGLDNGTEYTFQVLAESNAGRGASTSSNAVVPATVVPGAPKIVSVVAGDAQVDVVWEAPGRIKPNGYVVDVVGTDGRAPVSRTVDAKTTNATIGGLSNGAEYYVVIRATVANGASGPSASSATFVPRGRPGVAGSVLAAATGIGQVRVTWAAAQASGSAITGYEVGAVGLAAVQTKADETQATFSGLTVGSTYVFTVTAISQAGRGDPVAAPAVLIESQVPGPPGGVTAVPGNANATVSWTVSNGNGTTIDSYIVRNLANGTSRSAGRGATSLIYDGLTNGVAYSFDVRAVGANGTVGLAGTAGPGAVVPVGAPNAPTSVVATPTSPTAISVTFAQASPSNGTNVRQWRVTTTPDSGAHLMTVPDGTINGLTVGTAYAIAVVAIGDNGLESPAANVTATTPVPLPAAVTGLSIHVKQQTYRSARLSVTMSWTAVPGATGYRVDRGDGTAPFDVTTVTAAWSRLGDDSTYTATVTALNAYGPGPAASFDYYLPTVDPINCPVNKPYCIQP